MRTKGEIQPWKFVSVPIESNSVEGPALYGPWSRINPANGFVEEQNGHMYYPIFMDQNGYAMYPTTEAVVGATPKQYIGILMEVFQSPYVGCQVMVDGIAPLKIKKGENVIAGKYVIWSPDATSCANSGIKHVAVKTTGTDQTYETYPLGIALSSGEGNNGDVIPVLLKTIPDFGWPKSI